MATTTAVPIDLESPDPPRSRRKLLLGVLVLALVAGAAWWFVLRPASADQAPEPGVVVKLDAIQVNLADGHYLRIGIALQASKDAGEVEGSKALDATIDLFSGRPIEELSRKGARTALKQQLQDRLDVAYEGEVIGVYFTDFVTQ